MTTEKQLTLAKDQSTPLENFDARSAEIIGFQVNTNPSRLRETVTPLVNTIATIRNLLANVNIADLRNIANHQTYGENVSRQIGTIINTSEIEEAAKETLRQMVTAFFIRITAALSTAPRRGRPVGSRNTPKGLGTPHTKPARKPVDKAPSKIEIPEETIEQYKTALELTLENYNSRKEGPAKLDPTLVTSAKQIPAELKTMLRYIPFMIMARAKDKDKIQIAAVKALMDSPEGRKAAATALRRIFTNKDFSEISAGSMFAWVAPKFREESKDENPTRWESAMGELKEVEFPDHEGTIGEMLTDEPIED